MLPRLHCFLRHLKTGLALALLTTGAAHAAWVASPWQPQAGDVRAMVLETSGSTALLGGAAFTIDGMPRQGLARVDAATLALDTGFAPSITLGGQPGEVRAIAVQPSNGQIVIGGRFDHVNGVARNNIARLNADGTLDTTYDPDLTASPSGYGVEAMVLQSDEKLVVGGGFTKGGADPRSYLARLETTGALDAGFPDPGMDNYVRALAVRPDDSLVAGGFFNQAHGQPRESVVRLLANGSLDASFGDPAITGYVNALYSQPDGKLLVGGSLGQVGGQPRDGLARLNGNGTLDVAFTVDTDGTVNALARQSGTLVALAGGFEAIGGLTRGRVARIDTAGNGAVDPALTDVAVERAGYVVYSLLSLAPDRLLVGGWFARVDRQERASLAEILDVPGAPLAPSITQGQAGDGRLTLTIAPPAVPPANPITGYDVTCAPLGPGAAVSVSNAASPVTLTGLTNGTPYDCTARARNALGAGPAAEAAQYFTPQAAAGGVAAVPTMAEWALELLALVCAALGMRRARHAKRYI
ncbi:MAG: fibronectin type III domain-containing protein [Burkholderiaceae bacterium]